MIEIAIASGKGGVGKSTLAASLLIILKDRGWNVIGVDADADAPNLHLILGIDKWDDVTSFSDSKVAEIIDEKCIKCGECIEACPYGAIYIDDQGRYIVNQVYCEGCVTCKLVCPVKDAITYHKVDTGIIREGYTEYGFKIISARLRPGRPNSGKIVTEEKERARQYIEKDGIIIVDSAAGIGCQVISSLAGANMTILITEPTPAGFSDLKRIHKLTRHFMQPAALVINKYDTNQELTNEIIEYAKTWHIDLLGMIPYDDAIPYSMAKMKPVIIEYPDSESSKAIKEIALKVDNILRSWTRWMVEYRPKKPEPYKPILIKPKET